MDQIVIYPDDPLLWTYYAKIRQLQGQRVSHEGAMRRAFSNLLDGIGQKKDWNLVDEVALESRWGTGKVRPDGTLRDRWQLPHGWWEAKDTSDDLEREIEKKINTGYPLEILSSRIRKQPFFIRTIIAHLLVHFRSRTNSQNC